MMIIEDIETLVESCENLINSSDLREGQLIHANNKLKRALYVLNQIRLNYLGDWPVMLRIENNETNIKRLIEKMSSKRNELFGSQEK